MAGRDVRKLPSIPYLSIEVLWTQEETPQFTTAFLTISDRRFWVSLSGDFSVELSIENLRQLITTAQSILEDVEAQKRLKLRKAEQ